MRKWTQYIKEYKKDVILTPTYVLLEVIMDIILPLLMVDIIDNGIAAENMSALLKTGLVLIIACLLSLVFGFASGRYAARASAGFAKNLRKSLFHHIQNFSFSNIDHFSTNSLVTRLTTDVSNVQMAFQMILRICGRAPLMLVFSIVMAFRINARLAWIFIAAAPILMVGLIIIIRKANPVFVRVFKRYDRMNTVVQENLRGIRVVKSYVREDHEIEKFNTSSEDIYEDFVLAEKILAFNSPLMQSCMYGCTLILCWLGAQMIVSDTLTTGQMTSLLTYAMQILMSLMMLSMVFVMVTMSRASARRITEVLEETSDMPCKENAITTVADGSIVFDHVSFGYRGTDGKQALQDIDLHIPSGQTVGIIGGTGSGKSSLTQLIPRLYDASTGSVQVGGVDVRDYDLDTLREEVAMVLQKNVLFSGTIKDNLRWGNPNATEEEMVHACQVAQADSFIESFPDGYDTWITQGGSNVSGGQKQRLCIARALLKRPKILILDDSTSAVDTKTDALIRASFQTEIPGTTKIIIAQRIASVQEADQIVVLNDGRIEAVGNHNELLESSAIYREVYESQQKGGLDDGAA